jgi:hypothetical protein
MLAGGTPLTEPPFIARFVSNVPHFSQVVNSLMLEASGKGLSIGHDVSLENVETRSFP